jgi:hypothetical protein
LTAHSDFIAATTALRFVTSRFFSYLLFMLSCFCLFLVVTFCQVFHFSFPSPVGGLLAFRASSTSTSTSTESFVLGAVLDCRALFFEIQPSHKPALTAPLVLTQQPTPRPAQSTQSAQSDAHADADAPSASLSDLERQLTDGSQSADSLLQLLASSSSSSASNAQPALQAAGASALQINLPQLLRNLHTASMTPVGLLRVLLRLPLFSPQSVLRALSSGSLQHDALTESPLGSSRAAGAAAGAAGAAHALPSLADLWRKASQGLDLTSDLLALGIPTLRAHTTSAFKPSPSASSADSTVHLQNPEVCLRFPLFVPANHRIYINK